jgi:hypothetical protein
MLDNLLAEGYSKEDSQRKVDGWLKSIDQSWDDFVRDQTAILNAKLKG